MSIPADLPRPVPNVPWSRRDILRAASVSVAAAAVAPIARVRAEAAKQGAPGAAKQESELKPRDAFQAVFDAIKKFPLVGLCERHALQEEHDFFTALLFRPDLPTELTDIVVEFGNALHQDIADSFILEGQPVDNATLARIWRFTIGGGVTWDAPAYGQFFRAVRAVNWMRPPGRRIRVLLGDPAFDYLKVKEPADKPYVLSASAERDPHLARVASQEILAKGRHALLIAGSGHLLRGVKNDHTNQPNAATILSSDNPGKLFIIDPLLVAPNPAGESARDAAILKWTRPSIAALAGTWLGANPGPMAQRAISPEAGSYASQADAVLYLGPSDALTASRPDPALYQGGEYADELQRVKQITTNLGLPVNLDGMPNATAGARYFKR